MDDVIEYFGKQGKMGGRGSWDYSLIVIDILCRTDTCLVDKILTRLWSCSIAIVGFCSVLSEYDNPT